MQMVVSTRSQEPSASQEQPGDNGILVQILSALQGLAQSNLDTRGALMEVIQRLPVAPTAARGNGASSSVGGSGTAPGLGREGDQVARDAGAPPTVQTDPAFVRREVPRMTIEEDSFNL